MKTLYFPIKSGTFDLLLVSGNLKDPEFKLYPAYGKNRAPLKMNHVQAAAIANETEGSSCCTLIDALRTVCMLQDVIGRMKVNRTR